VEARQPLVHLHGGAPALLDRIANVAPRLDLFVRMQRRVLGRVDLAGRKKGLMTAQPQWPRFTDLGTRVGRHARPDERLAELQADKREATARLREVLEAMARKYGIPAKDVSYAIDGYADDMLSDLVYGIERELEHAAEEAAPLGPAGS
jgi:hypothetical protein